MLAIILILAFCFTEVNAQTIELGSGTSESSQYDASPVNIYYRRTVGQFIYTAAELSAAGASSSTPISEIGFYVTQSPAFNLPSYSIRVKHTNQNDVSSAVTGGGWTDVVDGINYNPTAGDWDMLDADNAFTWDGSSNIVFQVCWSRVNPFWNASGRVRIDPVANGFRFSRTDANGNSCNTTPNTVTSNRPQVRLIFLPGDTTYWTGNSSSQWNNADNWTAGVPSPVMNAVIPSGVSTMPVIPSISASAEYLRVENGATLTMSTSSVLVIHGDLINRGSIVTNVSEIIFEGEAAATFESTAQDYYDITIENPFGVSMSGNSITITNELTLEGGDLTTNGLVILESDAAGTARIPEVLNPCLYTIDMNDGFGDGWNGGFIEVLVNGVSAGKFAATGNGSNETFFAKSGQTIEIVYSAGNFENENSYDILDPNGATIFSDGTNPSTGTVFTTTSSCTFSNPVVGDVEVRRYIDAGQTHWRFLTTPVAGAQLEQFNDDFITSGIPGTDYPDWPTASDPWPSFYFYSETAGTTFDDGFEVPTNMTNTVADGQGVWIWCGDTISGTQGFMIDFFGPVRAGNINLPVSFTNASGDMDDDGWNMVANPYPGTIDWNSPNWTKNNIDDAVYIWNPDIQQYASYVAGVSTNSGSNLIASSQAFMVHANAANPSLVVTESCKANSDAAFLKAQMSTELIRMRVSRGIYSDEAVIRFDNNATDGFDTYADARKPFFATTSAPAIYSVVNGVEYSVNTLTVPTASVSIPLYFRASTNGTHVLDFIDLTAIEDMNCVILEDKLTGSYVNVLLDSSYAFQASQGSNPNRFVLHISVEASAKAVAASCVGVEDGAIELTGALPMYNAIISGPGLNTSASYNSNDTIASGLAAGQYTVQTMYPFYGCNAQFSITIDAPQVIDVYTDVWSPSCIGCSDGFIELDLSGGTEPYSINWTNMPVYTSNQISNLNMGTYEFTVTDANGCTITDEVELDGVLSTGIQEKSPVQLYPNPANAQVMIEGLSTSDKVLIYNASGELIQTLENRTQYELNTSTWSAGMYFINVNNTITKLAITH